MKFTGLYCSSLSFEPVSFTLTSDIIFWVFTSVAAPKVLSIFHRKVLSLKIKFFRNF